MKRTIRRLTAVLLLVAVAAQAGAVVVQREKRTPLRDYVKRLVIRALDQLGCPPG